MLRFCVLGSGSKGNATYIEANGTSLLLDAGFSGREIERRLAVVGIDPASLDAILVSHEHSDHIRGIGVLSRRFNLPVFLSHGTSQAAAGALDKLHREVFIRPGEAFELKDLAIRPFAVSHDAADPLGFVIAANGVSLGYCTDTGVVSSLMRQRLAGCAGLVLECNHDPVMLRQGPYPEPLKQRVRSKSGHLANSETMELLSELLHDGLEHVVLAHISETNNHPDIISAVVEGFCRQREESCPRLPVIRLASQDQVGEMILLGGKE